MRTLWVLFGMLAVFVAILIIILAFSDEPYCEEGKDLYIIGKGTPVCL